MGNKKMLHINDNFVTLNLILSHHSMNGNVFLQSHIKDITCLGTYYILVQ
jgi:hypothetical protein